MEIDPINIAELTERYNRVKRQIDVAMPAFLSGLNPQLDFDEVRKLIDTLGVTLERFHRP